MATGELKNGWGVDSESSPSKYSYYVNGEEIVELTGLKSDLDATKLGEAITIAPAETSASYGKITINQDLFDSESEGNLVVKEGLFEYELDDDLLQTREIDMTSLTLGEDHKTIKGSLKAFYEVSNDKKTFAYTKRSDLLELATIEGLSDNLTAANVVLGSSNSEANSPKNTVKLMASALPKDENTTVSIKRMTAGFTEKSKLGTQGVPISSLELDLKLQLATAEGDNLLLEESETGKAKLGFGAGASRWAIDEDDNTTATYNSVTKEGWTLEGNEIKYSEEVLKSIITVSGLSSALTLPTDDNNKVSIGTESAISIAEGTITIYTAAIPEVADKTVKITKAADAEGTYTVQLSDGAATNPKTGTEIGFDKKSPYWTYSGGSAIYQYNTDKGWELTHSEGSNEWSVSFTAEKTGDDATELFTIGGLATDLATTAATDPALGITFTDNAIKLEDGVIKLDKSKVFPTVDADGASLTESTITFTRSGNKYSENDPVYTIQLAGDNFKETLTVSDPAEVAVSSTVNASGSAFVTGKTDEYFTKETVESGETRSITWHASQSAAVFATISGLSANATDGLEINAETKVIKIGEAALGEQNVSIVSATGISGIDENNYTLSLDISDSSKYATEADQIYWGASPTINVDGGAATITGTTKVWYFEKSTNESDETIPIIEIEYHEADSKSVAKITGLADSASVAGSVSIQSVQTDSTNTDNKKNVIILDQKAYKGTSIITIENGELNGNFTLALKDLNDAELTDGNKTVGGDKVPEFWEVETVAGGSTTKATYKYYTNEKWVLNNAGTQIVYTEQSPDTILVEIEGLKGDLTTKTKDADNNDIPACIEGITVTKGEDDKITVELSSSVLGNNPDSPVKIIGNSDNQNYVFKLQVPEHDAGFKDTFTDSDKAIGFDRTDPAWEIIAGQNKAVFSYTQQEGWELKKEGNDHIIKYTPGDKVILAEITGLKNNITANDFNTINAPNNNDDDYKGVFEIKESMINHGSDVKLTTYHGGEYTLELVGAQEIGGVSTFGFDGISKASANKWTLSDDKKSAVYTNEVGEGWKLTGDSTIIHVSASSIKLAELTGLKGVALTDDELNEIVSLKPDANDKDIFNQGSFSIGERFLGSDEFKLSLFNGADFKLQLKDKDGIKDDGKLGFTGQSAALLSDASYKLTKGTDGYELVHTVGEGWSLSGTSTIIHTAESSATLANITGLKTGLGNSVLKGALSGTTYKQGTITIEEIWLLDDTDVNLNLFDGAGYSLALGDGASVKGGVSVFGFGESTAEDYFALDETAKTTAYLQHDIAKGWSLSGTSSIIFGAAKTNTIATIKNLADDVKITKTSNQPDKINGISISGESIILDTSVLNKKADTPLTFQADTYGLQIQSGSSTISGASTTITAIGFATNAAAWGIIDNIVVYQSKTDEGWKLQQTAGASTSEVNDDVWSVTYAGESYTQKVKISGLNTSGGEDQVASGLSIADNVITLEESVLDTETPISLTNIGSNSYYLALEDSIATLANSDSITKFHFEELTAENDSLLLKTTRDKGWVSSGGSKVLTYYDAIDDTLATISGLSVIGAKSQTGGVSNVSFSSADKTITLLKEALTSSDVVLKNSGANNYKLVLGDDEDENGDKDLRVGFGEASFDWTIGSDSTSATYYSYTGAGWEINAEGTKITYTSQENTRNYFVSISGLSKGFKEDVIDIVNDKIIVKAGALSNTNITVANGEDAGSTDYKLVFDSGLFDPNATDFSKTGFKINPAAWSVNNGTAVYSYITDAGWTLDDNSKKINYKAATTTNLVTITGLSIGLSAADLTGIVDDDIDTEAKYDGTIKLNGVWIKDKTNVKINLENGADYKLVFDQDLDKYGFGEVTNGSKDYWAIDGNRTAQLIRNIGSGWTISADGKAANYVAPSTRTIATISNIRSGVNTKTTADGLATIEGVFVNGSDSNGYNIELAENVLSKDTAKNNVLQIPEDSNIKFTLGLSGTLNEDGTLGFGQSSAEDYWAIESTTATYRHDVGEGWKLDDDTITYSKSKIETLISLTGLKPGLKAVKASESAPYTIDGITIDDKTVTLDKRVLGTTSVNLAGTSYAIALATGASAPNTSTSATENLLNVASNGVVSYTESRIAYYLVNGDTIDYYQPVKTKDLASITGLANGLVKGTVEETLSDDTKVTRQALGTETKDSAGNVTFTPVATFNDDNGTITLTQDALKKANVELTGSYKLALDRVPTSGYTDYNWTISKSSATLKATLIEGYTKESDTKIVYAAAKQNVPIITLTGLNATELAKRVSATDKSEINGIYLDETNNKVVLNSKLLSTSVAKVTGTAANGKSYVLSIDSDDGVEFYPKDGELAPGEKDIWKISGTTATYQKVIPAYYSLESNGTIKYHAEAAVKNGTKKNTLFVTIKGLASGLTVKDDNKIYKGDTPVLEITGEGTSDGKVTILSKEALGTSKVTLTNGNSGSYVFEFDPASSEVTIPQNESYRWEVNKTSALLKADVTEGYTLATTDKTITYTKPKANVTLLTITGLKNGITTNSAPTAAESDGSTTETLNTLYIDGTTNAIKFKAAEYDKYGKLDSKGTINLPYEMLGTTNVSFKGKDYEFVNISDVYAAETKPDEVNKWRVSGTTAKYTTFMPTYYVFNADKNGILYRKEAVQKNKSKDIDVITVTNLPKGAIVKPDDVDNVKAGVGYKDSDGTYKPYIEFDGSTVTVKDEALNKKDIKVTSSDYGVALENANEHEPVTETNSWSVSGTTATLKVITSEGYVVEGNTVKYKKPTTGKVAVTISGLAKGLKASKAGDSDGTNTYYAGEALGTYDADGKFVPAVYLSGDSVKLDEAAFGTSNITINNKNGSSYTLDITSIEGVAQQKTQFWSISGTTATLKEGTTTYFEVNEKKENQLLRRPAEITNAKVTTITGLKKGLTADAFGKIEGIEVDGKTITLSKSVLPTSTTGKVVVGSGYTLALGADVTEKYADKKNSLFISKASGSSTLLIGDGKTAGYTLDANDTQIVYKKAEVPKGDKLTVQLEGLKSGLTVDADGKVDGIEIDDTNHKITVKKEALGTKKISFKKNPSGDNAYELALGTGVTKAETTYQWFISGTTAYYKGTTTAGYRIDDKGNIVYSSKATTDANSAALIKITGLKKGLKVVDGKIDGITEGNKDANGVFTANNATDPVGTGKVIQLSEKVLGTTKITLTGTGYTLALDPAVKESGTGNMWTLSGDTATYRDSTSRSKGYELKNNTITYTAEKLGKTLATIKGINSDLKINNTLKEENKLDSQIVAIGSASAVITVSGEGTADNKYSFEIGKDAVADKDITVTGPNTKLTLASEVKFDSDTPTDFNDDQKASGILVYTEKKAKTYTVDTEKGTKITYTPETVLKTTITGLKSGYDKSKVEFKDGIFTVNTSELEKANTVRINGGDYMLALTNSTSDSDKKSSTASYYWKPAANGGSATFMVDFGAGGYYTDGKTIKYTENGVTQTLGTITGLNKDIKLKEVSSDATNYNDYKDKYSLGIYDDSKKYIPLVFADPTTGTFTLEAGALGTDKVTLSNSNYSLALDDTDIDLIQKADVPGYTWAVSGTTGSYYSGNKAYYTLAADKKSISYTPFNKDKTALAQVTGLKSGLKDSDLNSNIGVEDSNIYLPKEVLTTTASVQTALVAGSEYDLKLTETAGSTVSSESPLGGDPLSSAYKFENGVLIYGEGTEEKWTLKDGKIEYTPFQISSDKAKISGLKNIVVGDDHKVGGISFASNEFILNANVLPQNNVSLTSGGYSLATSGVNTVATPTVELILSGTKATVTKNTPESYVSEGNTIKYTPASTKNEATITGLSKEVSESDLTLNDKTITVNADALSTKVSISGNEYKLALGDDVDVLTATDSIKSVFSVSGTTVTYKNVNPAHYELGGSSNVIEFKKEKDVGTIAKVTGVKSGLKLEDDGSVPGIAVFETFNDDTNELERGEIIIGEEALGTKTIKIETSNSYLLNVDNNFEPEIDTRDAKWSYSGTTATYKGKVSAGFTLSKDKKSLTYSKANSTEDLIKITGINSGVTPDISDTTVQLSGTEFKTNSVTLNGTGRYSFEVGTSFTNGNIAGSAQDDTIRVEGFGVTVSGGKGDDYVVLYGHNSEQVTVKGTDGNDLVDTVETGDTYIYSGGNDVIADFSSYDKIKAGSSYDLKNATIKAVDLDENSTVKADMNDVEIRFGKDNSITLEDFITNTAQNTLPSIFFNDTEYTWSKDNNGAISNVSVKSSGYAVEDYSDFSLTPTLKDSNVIITGGGDKKK